MVMAIIFSLFFDQQCLAQVESTGYSFKETKNVTLAPIGVGTVSWSAKKLDLVDNKVYNIYDQLDNQYVFYSIPLGFDFNYCGQVFTHFDPRTDLYVALLKSSAKYVKPGTDYPGQLDTYGKNILAPLWDDQVTACRIKRTGRLGNYIMTIEYYDIEWSMGNVSKSEKIQPGFIQVKLYEFSGVIEYIYDLQFKPILSSKTHIGIKCSPTKFLSVTPGNPATTSSVTPFSVKTNIGLGEGTGNHSDVMYTFTPLTVLDDHYTISPGKTLKANVTNNDRWLGKVNTIIAKQAKYGTVTLNANGSFTYIANSSTSPKIDQFVYRLNGRTATVTLTPNALGQVHLKTEGTIRGATSSKIKVEEVVDQKQKLRWYDKNNYFTTLKCNSNESFLIVSFQLKPGYSLSMYDYDFKTTKKTYHCLSVSTKRGFGVNLKMTVSNKKNTTVKMLYKITKGDVKGKLVFQLNSTIAVPFVSIPQ